MLQQKSKKKNISKEAWFQFALIPLLFLFFAFDRHEHQFKIYKLWFFCNYIGAALFINYFLLPKFFYKKKYFTFGILLSLTFLACILIEELILEPIFIPVTYGKVFASILHTLTDIFPTISVFVGWKFVWDALKKQQDLDQLQNSVVESQLQVLKSQINPHFLFNNLNTLYAFALENSPQTPEIILELSNLLRYMLYDCKEEYVLLEKEITYLDNFVKLQKLQFEKRANIDFNVIGSISTEYISPLILIVFIENCFKHSSSSQVDNIEIKITITVEQGVLKMSCENTYEEKSNIQNLTGGIGLENVQTRLNFLYPDAHVLRVEKKNKRYNVFLELKLKTTN